MKLTHVPLLSVQRDLYRLPRGMDRFREYLRTMIDPTSGDLGLPLVAMNPMGKEHVPERLDRLIAVGAEDAAARAVAECARVLAGEPGEFSVALVVSDDLKGGWTNRWSTDFGARFQPRALTKRGWITVLLWTSESYDAEAVYREAQVAIHRTAWIVRRGEPKTLAAMLAQEGHALHASGATGPAMTEDERARVRAVLAPLLDRGDLPTAVAALFGDEAAQSLGFAPLGLRKHAGLTLALADAISSAAAAPASKPHRGLCDRRPRP